MKPVDTVVAVRNSASDCIKKYFTPFNEEAGLKKFVYIVASLLLVMAMSLPALAEAEKCNAIPWGEPLSAVEQVTFSHAAGGVRYYTVNKVEACGISKRYLHDLFKDVNGTVSQQIRDQRLVAARDRLQASRDLSISEVAYRFGFADQAQFSRLFKAKFGMTPSEFQRSAVLRPA